MKPVPVPDSLLGFISVGKRFLVAGHKEPDGDCVGSQLALASALRRLGKSALPCSPGPFKRPEIIPYAPLFTAEPTEAEREDARVIVLDCSNIGRTGDLEPFLSGLPTAVIDHHASSDSSGDAIFLDGAAPSVTFMVLAVIEALGLKPTREEAELLFFGLCTDTGFFRHVDEGGAPVFEYAARLIDAGANPKRAFQAMSGGKSLESRRLMGLVLSRVEPFFGGRLLLSWETEEDTARFGLQGRDSDALYQLLQSVGGVEAVVLIRQETSANCTVGLRSRETVDVAAIAGRFGGGGHRQAAGLSTVGTIAELREKIVEAFASVFL
ncbi:MAG: phosphoesterase [Treponema sp. RIFOXYC1_FULL_61_9]|nr:MAG: phosphoesterase [Treponema sp. RIFOXYC1_FULL_61_9]